MFPIHMASPAGFSSAAVAAGGAAPARFFCHTCSRQIEPVFGDSRSRVDDGSQPLCPHCGESFVERMEEEEQQQQPQQQPQGQQRQQASQGAPFMFPFGPLFGAPAAAGPHPHAYQPQHPPIVQSFSFNLGPPRAHPQPLPQQQQPQQQQPQAAQASQSPLSDQQQREANLRALAQMREQAAQQQREVLRSIEQEQRNLMQMLGMQLSPLQQPLPQPPQQQAEQAAAGGAVPQPAAPQQPQLQPQPFNPFQALFQPLHVAQAAAANPHAAAAAPQHPQQQQQWSGWGVPSPQQQQQQHRAVMMDPFSQLFFGGAPMAAAPGGVRAVDPLGGLMQNLFGGLFGAPRVAPANGQAGDYFVGGAEQFNQLLHSLLQAGQGGRRSSPPASASVVTALPDVTLDGPALSQSANTTCSVCLDDFAEGNVVKQLPCRHTYHPQCLLPWLKEHNTCPSCRFVLPTDDPEYEQRRAQLVAQAAAQQQQQQQQRQQGQSAAAAPAVAAAPAAAAVAASASASAPAPASAAAAPPDGLSGSSASGADLPPD